MQFLKPPFMGICMAAMTFLAGCNAADKTKAPVTLTWEMGTSNVEPGYYENSFVLKNVSDNPIGKTWSIYYSQLPRKVKMADNATVKVEVVNGNFFKMSPTEQFASLAPGDSMRIVFRCSYKLDRNSHAPEATYWVEGVEGQEGKPLPVALKTLPLKNPESLPGYPDATKIYQSNLRVEKVSASQTWEILPSVKRAVAAQGILKLEGRVSLSYSEVFSKEANWLKGELATRYGQQVTEGAPVSIVLETLGDKSRAVNSEYYTLKVDAQGVRVAAATPHGIFNGVQTFLAMLKGQQTPYELSSVAIEDYPDMAYRGLMFDISRDFTTVDDMKKLIDAMASYKMNRLHFHFNDDEAWRLEIPGLEELTSVGSRRGHTSDESTCLYPCYEGSFDPEAKCASNGFYTRAEFIDLLQYAAQRHVSLVPEIESPGHARAAIVSMNARYNKYAATDMAKATEYWLSEPEDTSHYKSVQYYSDNVMNPALPSTYRFMEKVVEELIAMYRDAGVELPSIHLGGDEVPRGVWVGSPKCQALMKEKGMTKLHDLSEYFITRLADIVTKHGAKFSGWQEVALGHSEEAHNQLRGQVGGVYCWNTVPGSDEVVYQTANNGYPVILCNVGNFYMDMAYSGHPDERGLDWGGYVDESISFSMLPYTIYRSLRADMNGNPIDLDKAAKGKTQLTAEGRRNIVGVQGQLFAETIRSYKGVEYMLFPKLMGLVERGWNAHPVWETMTGKKEEQAFNLDLSNYYRKINDKEMPAWAQKGINFRLPHPGLLVKDGMLYANVPLQGAEIRYTTDGSEPTPQSQIWKEPVQCDASVIKAAVYYQGKQSHPITLVVK